MEYNSIFLSSGDKADANLIIIDDNQALTDAWILSGEMAGKHVVAFNKINDFRSVMTQYNKNVPIYIDSDLNDIIKGQDFAKELYEDGFVNIYLATGFLPQDFPKMYWIKEVVGKEPPF